VNLYVESSDRLVSHRDPDDVLAVTWRGNPLAERPPIGELGGPEIVMWSGTLGEGLFDPHPPNWLSPGHTALRELCGELSAGLVAADTRICFHPHGRHVLSDTQSCRAFLGEATDDRLGVALAPGSTLEPSMIAAVDDHLTRAFEGLGGQCRMVILHDVAPGPGGERLEPVPLGDGLLPRDVVRDLLKRCVPVGTPIVIGAERLDQQIQWLRG
jgi:hypothetical protein